MTVNLRMIPTSGEFDVPAIRAWLDSKPNVFESPREPNSFFLVGLPSTADYAFEEMSASPSYYPRCCETNVDVSVLYLQHEHGHLEDAMSAMEFFEWLVSTTACRVEADGPRDITDDVRERGSEAVYSHHIRELPLEREGTLVNIGRFRELEHGWSAGPSLERARRPSERPDDERIATYLQSGHLYERADDDATDYFDRNITLGPPHLLTDGVYVWPADLPYYVRTYHVELPRAFAIHVRANGWRVPTDIDIASLPSIPF